MTMAGAGMLWIGWFGFNGGSALAADTTAAAAILATRFAAAAAWSAIATYVIVRLADRLIGVRVSREEERDGLDLATHGERAYDLT